MALDKGELSGQFGQRAIFRLDGSITGADPQYNTTNVNPDMQLGSAGLTATGMTITPGVTGQ